jgi:hypothetical protein
VVEDPNDPDSQTGIENSKFKIPDGLISARLSSFQISNRVGDSKLKFEISDLKSKLIFYNSARA